MHADVHADVRRKGVAASSSPCLAIGMLMAIGMQSSGCLLAASSPRDATIFASTEVATRADLHLIFLCLWLLIIHASALENVNNMQTHNYATFRPFSLSLIR